jgi:hypothetical protein
MLELFKNWISGTDSLKEELQPIKGSCPKTTQLPDPISQASHLLMIGKEYINFFHMIQVPWEL